MPEAFVDQGELSPLHWSTWLGQLETTNALLENGGDIDAKDQAGNTPLVYAMYKKHSTVVDLLLAKGPDVETLGKNGLNTMHLAANMGRAGYLDKILAIGELDPDILTESGYSAMHLAVLAGQIESVKVLIDRGAKVNLRTKTGEAPIHLAVKTRQFALVQLLSKRGAELHSVDQFGRTPLVIAEKKPRQRDARPAPSAWRAAVDPAQQADKRSRFPRQPAHAARPEHKTVEGQSDRFAHPGQRGTFCLTRKPKGQTCDDS